MAWKKNTWGDAIGASETKLGAREPARSNAHVKKIVTGLVIVCVLVVWFLLTPSNPRPSHEEKKVPSAQKKCNVTTKQAKAQNASTAKMRHPDEMPAKSEVEPVKPVYVKKPGQLQLPNGKILTFPPPKEGETRKVYAYGHLYECDHEGNFRDVSERRLFKTAFEGNFLALAAQNKPFIPAFLTGLDESEVRKMLEKPYEPIGDETEDEKAKLKAYDQMRNAALEYMAQGGSFDEFVETFASFAKKERETRATCLREVMTLYKQGKVAEAKEMLQASDILTDRKGFKQIRIPPHVQAAFDKLP